MPNWTFNRVICKKEIGDKILTKEDDKYILDFNKLLPMPQSLNLPAGSLENEAVVSYYMSLDKVGRRNMEDCLEKIKIPFYENYWKKYKSNIYDYISKPNKLEKIEKDFDGKLEDYDKVYTSLSELGKDYVDNIIKYGYPQWYDWRNEIWGTKWNVEDEVDVNYYPDSDEYVIEFNTAWNFPYGIVEEYSKLCSDDEFNWEYINEDYDGHHYLKKENGVISGIVIMDIEDEEDYEIQ